MNINQLAQLIGREADLNTDGIHVGIRILDVKRAYGRTRYVVTPLDGHGTVTVEDHRVTLREGV